MHSGEKFEVYRCAMRFKRQEESGLTTRDLVSNGSSEICHQYKSSSQCASCIGVVMISCKVTGLDVEAI